LVAFGLLSSAGFAWLDGTPPMNTCWTQLSQETFGWSKYKENLVDTRTAMSLWILGLRKVCCCDYWFLLLAYSFSKEFSPGGLAEMLASYFDWYQTHMGCGNTLGATSTAESISWYLKFRNFLEAALIEAARSYLSGSNSRDLLWLQISFFRFIWERFSSKLCTYYN
jgi:hypothetical protein